MASHRHRVAPATSPSMMERASFPRTVWRPLDPQLLGAAWAGEHLVARIRFVVLGLLLTIPAAQLLVTGLAAVVEYLLTVLWAMRHAAAAAPSDAARYGGFEWDDQFARMVLLLMATLLAAATVVRSRELLQLSTRDRLTGLPNRGALD